MSITRKCYSALVLVALLSAASFAQSPKNEERPVTNPSPEQVLKAMDKIPPITVYGKVVDQEGASVEGAEIERSWKTPKIGFGWATDVKSDWITTDKDGCFKWTLIKSFDPNIRRLKKEGYDFVSSENPYFNPNTGGDLLIGKTTKENPLLLYLRKKGETTYLVKNENNPVNLKVPPGGVVVQCPDVMPKTEMENNLRETGNRQIGFSAKVEYATNDANVTCKLTLIAPEGGGLLFSDKRLYAAPEQGYQSEASVSIIGKQVATNYLHFTPKQFWVLIKTGDPVVYAMLDVHFDGTMYSVAKTLPSIRFNTLINPYGERNFEEETGLDTDTSKELEKQSRISLRDGRQAEKPDLPKLIKDAKNKADNDKSKQ